MLVTPVLSQEKNIWFPCPNYFPFLVLSEFIDGICSSDKNTVRDKYYIILAFMDDIIIAYYENIERFFGATIFSLKRPALVEGGLIIVETIIDNAFSWDGNLELYKINHNIIHPINEAADIIASIRIRNYLISFWYKKTGELLANHINENDHINYIQRIIEFYQNKGEQNQLFRRVEHFCMSGTSLNKR